VLGHRGSPEVIGMVRNTRSARSAVPAWIEPMLAKADGGRLPTGSSIAYEYKVDGYRCSMGIAPDGTTALTSRNGNDFTAEFATLTGVLTDALEGETALLDGEIVVYNEHGAPDFGLLQQRRGRHTRRTRDRAEPADIDVRFLAFDVLHLGGNQLIAEPYDERRRILTALPMPDPHRVAIIPAVTFDELTADRRTPHDFLDQAAVIGHEGLVAKVRNSIYLPGKRSDAWKKHPFVLL
jgi:bifunctional non-homologous end joining protein LigD